MTQFHEFVRGVDRHEMTLLGRYDGTNATTSVQRYTHGTLCSLKDSSARQREATIVLLCGERDRILNVREPLRCHYEITLELRATCGSEPG